MYTVMRLNLAVYFITEIALVPSFTRFKFIFEINAATYFGITRKNITAWEKHIWILFNASKLKKMCRSKPVLIGCEYWAFNHEILVECISSQAEKRYFNTTIINNDSTIYVNAVELTVVGLNSWFRNKTLWNLLVLCIAEATCELSLIS